jgi:integrase
MKTITDRGIRALKPKPHKTKPGEFVPYRVADSQTRGLNIQVSKAGKWNWSLRYHFGGKQRFLKLGTYPATSISEARKRAIEAQAKIEAGTDPAKEQRHVPDTPTVKRLLEAYLDDREKEGTKSVKYMRLAFKKNVVPYIGQLPASDVTTEDITELLRRVVARGAITVARRVQQYTHAAFAYGLKAKNDPNVLLTGVDYGLKFNPVSGTQTVRIRNKAEDHYPSLQELAVAWNNIDNRSGPEVASAFRFHVAMGGQRVKEACHAEWEWLQEVNGVLCFCIPKNRTKTGIPHTVPVGKHARAVIDSIRPYTGNCKVLFPQRNASTVPIDYTSLSNAVRKLRNEYKLSAWTPKQLRRTAKTVMSDNGMDLHKLDYWQNHNQRTTVSQRHYLRAIHLNEKVEVMKLWDRLLGDALAEYKRAQMKVVA